MVLRLLVVPRLWLLPSALFLLVLLLALGRLRALVRLISLDGRGARFSVLRVPLRLLPRISLASSQLCDFSCTCSLSQDGLKALPQGQHERVLLPQASRRNLRPLSIGHRCLVPAVQKFSLHTEVVVRDRQCRVVILGRCAVRRRNIDSIPDQLQSAQGVLQSFLVLVQLRQDGAQIQMRSSDGHIMPYEEEIL